MTQKVAVALVHGIGEQTEAITGAMEAELMKYIKAVHGDADGFVIKPVFWAPVLQPIANTLYQRLKGDAVMRYDFLRRIIIDYVGDALAYQPTPGNRAIYDEIHAVFARTLRQLAEEAGATAPLVVIAHSLGTVLSSNYLYDLQYHAQKKLLMPSVLNLIGVVMN